MKALVLAFVGLLLVGCSGKSGGQVASKGSGTSGKAGWTQAQGPGFAISLPSDWKVVVFKQTDLDKEMDDIFGNEPEFAQVKRQSHDLLEKGDIKLVGFGEIGNVAGFRDNCTVLVKEIPKGNSLDEIADLNRKHLSQLAQGDVRLSEIAAPAGRQVRLSWHTKAPAPSGADTVQFTSLRGTTLAVVTFTGADGQKIGTIADQSIQTLKLQ